MEIPVLTTLTTPARSSTRDLGDSVAVYIAIAVALLVGVAGAAWKWRSFGENVLAPLVLLPLLGRVDRPRGGSRWIVLRRRGTPRQR